jgi:hypothetical protein
MEDVIENGNTEIVPVIASDTLIAIAEQAEKRADAMNKIKRVAIKLTNRFDWTDQGGKPYLQVSGAEKIARMFGISWRIDEPEMDREESGHFAYSYKGYFSLAGATIEAIGTRSSKDGFFKKFDWSEKDKDGNSIKIELPASEIDKGDVKKSAYTNCIGNGITRLLGIRNMTYEDLLEFAGLTKDMIAKIDYKKSGKQDQGIKSEGAQTARVHVSDVRKSSGKTKAGKGWTAYTVKNGNAEYKTFSESLAKIAKDAMEAGLDVDITFKVGQYGNDIESLCKVEPTAAETREPGSEG